jgi:hypothetical protein
MRFVLLLAVILVVLFGISMALGSKRGRDKPNPTNSWASRLNERFKESQTLNVDTDLKSDCKQGAQLLIRKETPFCTVIVLPKTNRPIRKAELKLAGADEFSVRYEPSPADPEAMTLDIPKFNSGRALNLVFQKHGGTLKLTRKGALAPATVTIK